MKLYAFAAVAAGFLLSPACAADLATAYPVKAAPVAVPAPTWTGFYIGANGGYVGGTAEVSTPNDVPVYTWRNNSSGFSLGGQVGYNFQFANNIVVGAEADLQWTNLSGISATQVSAPVVLDHSFGGEVDYFGTIRARAGYAIGNVLPYVTGGVAYGNTSYVMKSVSGTSLANNYDNSKSSTQWGWTAGAGLEVALADHWTVKGEYLYVDLDTMTIPGTSSSRTLDTSFNALKMGVNYKF